jgi:hypothetical protein
MKNYSKKTRCELEPVHGDIGPLEGSASVEFSNINGKTKNDILELRFSLGSSANGISVTQSDDCRDFCIKVEGYQEVTQVKAALKFFAESE